MAVSIPLAALRPDSRMAERSTPNPYDKATIFSIYPQEIKEIKRTIYPDIYIIPPGTPKAPSRLVVGAASWFRDVGIDEPLLEIPTSAVMVAESIVRDYQNSRIGSNMGDAVPGIFFVPGEIDLKGLVSQYPQELERSIQRQMRWYEILVKQADSLWAVTNGNPIAIPEDCKLACKELSWSRDWATDFKRITMEPCPACGQLRNPLFPICGSCKFVVDKKKAQELGIISVS